MSKYFNLLTPVHGTVGVNSSRPGRYALLKSAAIFAVAMSLSALSAETLRAAEPTQDSLQVSYADLNLSNEAGRAALRNRIEMAATEVCGGLPGARSLEDVQWFKNCRDKAIADSTPLVTAAIDAANLKAAIAAANSKVASQEVPH